MVWWQFMKINGFHWGYLLFREPCKNLTKSPPVTRLPVLTHWWCRLTFYICIISIVIIGICYFNNMVLFFCTAQWPPARIAFPSLGVYCINKMKYQSLAISWTGVSVNLSHILNYLDGTMVNICILPRHWHGDVVHTDVKAHYSPFVKGIH